MEKDSEGCEGLARVAKTSFGSVKLGSFKL
jgi:hypothetical protein